jgi:hypothetical protein
MAKATDGHPVTPGTKAEKRPFLRLIQLVVNNRPKVDDDGRILCVIFVANFRLQCVEVQV